MNSSSSAVPGAEADIPVSGMSAALFALALAAMPAASAADATTCGSAAQCNRLGSAAYEAGRSAEAALLFDRQIDFAETAIREAEEPEAEALLRARDLALNNAALARLQAGECGQAKAYLSLARGDARATQANRSRIAKACIDHAASGDADPLVGDYWQYAGHGLWNRVTLRPTGDETLVLEAFWQRISRGPLDLYGIAAMGELQQVAVFTDDGRGTGRFDGLDGSPCILALELAEEAMEVTVQGGPECQTGGAGAHLGGRFLRVSRDPGEAPVSD